MPWEAVTALATLASALIVAIAAVAAVIQIRHLRAGNQLEAVLRIYDIFNSREMIEARKYCLDDFPATLQNQPAIDVRTVDPRVTLVANFHNTIGGMVADGFIVERLVWPLVPVTARLWDALEPAGKVYRAQRSDPVWADFEYIAALRNRITPQMYVSRYPAWFQQRLRAELAAIRAQPASVAARSETPPG